MKKNLMLQLFADDPVEKNSNSDNLQEQEKGEDVPGGSKGKDKETAKYTDEDVNRLIDQKFAEWQKKKDKEVSEAQKLAEMNAQQKAEYERDQFKKRLEEYQKKDTLADMERTARKMLSENDIVVSDELLSMMVCTDAEQTKAAVDGFVKAFTEAVETAVKARLRGESPKKGSGTKTTMTKEQIMKIQDPELRQQKMLENRELFNF